MLSQSKTGKENFYHPYSSSGEECEVNLGISGKVAKEKNIEAPT